MGTSLDENPKVGRVAMCWLGLACVTDPQVSH